MVTSRKATSHETVVGKNPPGNDDRMDRIYRTDKRLPASDAPPLGEPLCGYIFVCNQDTMDEDLRLMLFGLPLRYLESVKCIQPGMPLFLYNYTTHKLHGVYEATSAGGQNLDPDAWENKEFARSSNGGVVSRFPAQVRIKVREEKFPLDEGIFRKVLFHYEGSKFRLELGKVEVEELFQLFGVLSSRPRENVHVRREDDDGGEWEKVTVKGKNKGFSRSQGGIAWKAPNPSAKKGVSAVDDRRRGFGAYANGGSGGLSSSSYDHSMGGETSTRGRDREARGGDNGGRWRNDEAWGSTSGVAGSSSSGALEDERNVKHRHENGDVRASSEVDKLEGNGSRSRQGRHFANGSGDGEALSERSSDRSSDAAGSPKATLAGGSWLATRAGPVSYSAVLKAGLDGAAEPVPTVVAGKVRQAANADSSAASTSSASGSVTRGLTANAQNGKQDRVEGELNGMSSDGRADTMSTTGSQQSRGSSVAGDDKPADVSQQRALENGGISGSDLAVKMSEKPLGAWGKRSFAVVSAVRPGESTNPGNGSWSRVTSGVASGLTEAKSKDGMEGKRALNALVSESGADGQGKDNEVCDAISRGLQESRGPLVNVGECKSPSGGNVPKAGAVVKQVGESGLGKSGVDVKPALAKNASEPKFVEAKAGGINSTSDVKPLVAEGKSSETKPVAVLPAKKAWQGNEAAVLRRLADPDPAPSTTARVVGPASKTHQEPVPAVRATEVQGSASSVSVDEQANPTASAGSRQAQGVSSTAVERQDSTATSTPKLEKSPPGRLGASTQSRSPQETTASPVSFQHQRSTSAQVPNHYHRRQQQIPQEFHQRQGDRPRHSPSERQQQVQQHRRPQAMQMQQPRQEQLPLPLLPPPLQQGPVMVAPLRVNTPPQVQSPSFSGSHHQMFSPVGPLPSPQHRQGIRSGGRGGGNRNIGLEVPPGMVFVRGDGPMAMPSGHLSPAWGHQSPVMMQAVMSPIGGNPNFNAPPNSVLANLDLPALHEEILEFALHARPSAMARARAEAAVECVRNAVQQLWPGSDVEIFGSFATGLCLPHSDVDCVVVGAPNPSSISQDGVALPGRRALAPLIRELAIALRNQPWCEALSSIETASMPVVKLRCRPPPSEGLQDVCEAAEASQQSVAIDITIGGQRQNHGSEGSSDQDGVGDWRRAEAGKSTHNGAAAREFVIERLRRMPALAPLVLLMKSYLHHRGLKDVYSGGLGSFSLTLMLVFYLERVPVETGTPFSGLDTGNKSGEAKLKTEEQSSSIEPEQQCYSDGMENLSVASLSSAPCPPAAEQPTPSLTHSSSSKELVSPVSEPALATEIAAGRSGSPQLQHPLQIEEAGLKPSPENVASTSSEREIDGADQGDSGINLERQGGMASEQDLEGGSSSSCSGGNGVESTSSVNMGTQSHAAASGNGAEEDRADSCGVGSPLLSRKEKQSKKVGIAEEIVESMLTVPSPNLAILLCGFLHVFGEALDMSLVKLVLKGNHGEGGVFLQDPKRPRVGLWIDDPLRPGSNIGAGSFAMFYVQQAMREMLGFMRGIQSQGSEMKLGNQRRRLPILDSLFLQPQHSRTLGQLPSPA